MIRCQKIYLSWSQVLDPVSLSPDYRIVWRLLRFGSGQFSSQLPNCLGVVTFWFRSVQLPITELFGAGYVLVPVSVAPDYRIVRRWLRFGSSQFDSRLPDYSVLITIWFRSIYLSITRLFGASYDLVSVNLAPNYRIVWRCLRWFSFILAPSCVGARSLSLNQACDFIHTERMNYTEVNYLL